MNCTVLCISSMCDGLSTLTLDQKYRGLKNHVKSANVSLLKTRQHVKSKGKTKRQTKSSLNMKAVLVNTKQLPEQETSFLTETTKKSRENTKDEHNDCHKRKTDTHTHKTRHGTAAGTDVRIHRHWVDAMPTL